MRTVKEDQDEAYKIGSDHKIWPVQFSTSHELSHYSLKPRNLPAFFSSSQYKKKFFLNQ